jgi:excinuclease ABC subunit C
MLPIVKNLPEKPGVYRMLNALQEVLYVGKALNLKKRVSSYFKPTGLSVKTDALVSQIAHIEVTVTRNEIEALLLESSLIKALRPKYNVLMRDDKSYPYLHLTLAHAFPSLKSIRCKKKPQEKGYYGPYPSLLALRESLNLIQKIFKLRNCSNAFFNARSRPCLQYQLKRCTAPCVTLISEQDYALSVQQAEQFLQGKSLQVIRQLETRMQAAVTALAFEDAARIRDQIKALRHIQEQQHVVRLRGDVDVVALRVSPGFACVQWVMVRAGQVLATQAFFPKMPRETLSVDDVSQQVFQGFMTYFYQDNPERIPPMIITEPSAVGYDALQRVLSVWRGRACRINDHPRGHNAQWLALAKANLQQACLDHDHAANTQHTRHQALQQVLGLSTPIERLVCFDVSHTQGQDTVASCVVFDANGPCKRAYRRFYLRDITPGDDYAGIAQAVTRYCQKLSSDAWPRVMIIDGGVGQVAAAQNALAAFPAASCKLIGITKGEGRKACFDRVLDAEQQSELMLAPDSPALHLIQQLRDEAHRFAITLHRKKRQTTGLTSSLLSIPGVGSKRRHALLQRFGGLRELTKATIDEIAKVQGISTHLAETIYQHLHQNGL